VEANPKLAGSKPNSVIAQKFDSGPFLGAAIGDNLRLLFVSLTALNHPAEPEGTALGLLFAFPALKLCL
jgi:hypothetical protein